jgi:hypothetical protein
MPVCELVSIDNILVFVNGSKDYFDYNSSPTPCAI